MATVTTGLFFLARREGVRVERAADGAFRLVLRLLDRQGPHRVEAYQVAWSGPEAAAWWSDNREIGPGTPLELELENPRSMPSRFGGPETHATVTSCRRARVAPSWEASASRAAATSSP